MKTTIWIIAVVATGLVVWGTYRTFAGDSSLFPGFLGIVGAVLGTIGLVMLRRVENETERGRG